MAKLVMKDVSKTYPGGHTAVKDLNLETTEGELVVTVGPSGCGKTTALRMIAGLEEITSGRIELDGTLLNDMEPGKRDVAMVFQNYALYPHMSVYGNISFPLREHKVPKRERDERTREVAAILGLEDQLDKKPGQLSGGQRQRVAMGRAIVRRPRLFLMDEPLSNLDANLRGEMRTEIHAIQRRLGITTVYVTHDQVEAMTLGDRVAVMRDGVLQQLGSPGDVYERPTNVFVANFVGNPGCNLFLGEVVLVDGKPSVRIGEREVRVDDQELALQPALRERVGSPVTVGVRPEAMVLGDASGDRRRLPGVVALCEALGSSVLGYLEIPGIQNGKKLSETDEPKPAPEGSPRQLVRGTWAVGRFAANVRLAEGTHLEVSVLPGGMRFFEPESGLAL
jgi:multiple sugar transport system ATP-binding protein